jgi:hypothetical protein
MDEYSKIEKRLGDISKIQDDKIVILSLLTMNSIELLRSVDILIENNKGSMVAPLLRQVYEISVIQMGLQLSEISVNDFITFEAKSEKTRRNSFLTEVSKKIHSNSIKDVGRMKADIFKGLMMQIHSALSTHTHANLDRLVYFTGKRFNDDNSKIFNIDINFMKTMVSALFNTVNNEIFGLELAAKDINYNEINDELTKIVSKQVLPSGELVRLMSISAVSSLFKNRAIEMKEILTKENIEKVKKLFNE